MCFNFKWHFSKCYGMHTWTNFLTMSYYSYNLFSFSDTTEAVPQSRADLTLRPPAPLPRSEASLHCFGFSAPQQSWSSRDSISSTDSSNRDLCMCKFKRLHCSSIFTGVRIVFIIIFY